MEKKMVDNVDEMVTISKKMWDKLLDDYSFLKCLTRAGVDNWEGYDNAVEEYQNKKN